MLRRRLLTVPGYIVAWIAWMALAPAWLLVAAATDLFRRNNGVALRCALVVTVYLGCEMLGLAASLAFWAWRKTVGMDRDRWLGLHFRLQAWWGATLLRAVIGLFGMRFEVEGDIDLGRGPYILLLRHASTADTLLASALISWPHGLMLRYVLKRELLWDPCLDIVGNRIPNVFVDRAAEDSGAEVERIRQLACDLGPDEGVLIYPEGTRFSESKREQVLSRLRREGDAELIEYSESLACVLPPRTAGTLALREGAPGVDVVICTHTGFEGAASLAQIWRGDLLHGQVSVDFRRVAGDQVPSGRDAGADWLRAEWQKVDVWVTGHVGAGSRQEPKGGLATGGKR